MASLSWSTTALRPREQFSYWHDAVCDAFLTVATERPRGDAFEGSIRSYPLGAVTFTAVRSEAHDVLRTKAGVARTVDDQVFVNLQLRGRCVMRQDGRELVMVPGDSAFIDGTRRFDLLFVDDMQLVCIQVPRRLLAARLGRIDARTCMPLSDTPGVGALLRSYLTAVGDNIADIPGAQYEAVAENLCDLIGIAAGAAPRTLENGPAALRAAQRQAVMAYIRTMSADPELSPGGAARHFRCSVRTLHGLFEGAGTTFGRYLREQRLLACYRALTEAARRDETVAQIAFAAGFNDLSYFHRRFRERFGVTPDAARRDAAEPSR
jgi:AraC family transcriptional activator of tynA and feaB